jgi:hypothetical protein
MAGLFAAFTELEAERRRASATAHTGTGFSRTRRGTSAGPSRTFFDNVAQCTGKTARAKLRVPHDNEPGPRVREDVDETKRKLEAKRLPLFGES